MKAMTIVVKFEEGAGPEPVDFDDKVLGCKATALTAYNVMYTMAIAEEALENSLDDRCIEVAEKIDKYIVREMGVVAPGTES